MSALSILLVAAVMAAAVYLDRKDKRRELVLSYCVGLVDEAIAIAEMKSVGIKRETVFQAARNWQKQAPEKLKDQVAADKFMQEAMVPARDIAHKMAKSHIFDVINGMPDGDFKKSISNLLCKSDVVDECIKIRIICSKINIPDPLRPFLYRFI